MKPTSSLTIKDLKEMQLKNVAFDLGVIPERPGPVATFSVSGIKFGFRAVWSRAIGADGYEILIAAGNNMSAPEKKIEVAGGNTMDVTYFVGDHVLARTFTIHPFKNYSSEGRIYGNLFYPFQSATSKGAAGAADTAPLVAPTPTTPPSTEGTPTDPGGIPLIK